MPIPLAQPQVRIGPMTGVYPGEAWNAPFQTACIIEMCLQAQEKGWTHPYSLAVGSSSGSPMAVVAAAASPLDHNTALNAWKEFRRLLGPSEFVAKSRPGNFWRFVHDAVDTLFEESGLLEWDKAYESQTNVVIVVTAVDKEHGKEVGSRWFDEGLDHFTSATGRPSLDSIAGEISSLGAEGTTALFKPIYYATKPWPENAREDEPENYTVLANADALKNIVRASAWIPLVAGGWTMRFGEHNLIDSAWSNNVPIHLAAAMGGDYLHLVDCSRAGKLFDKPIFSYPQKHLGRSLDKASRLVGWLEERTASRAVSRLDRVVKTLRHNVPDPKPLDLEEIERANELDVWHDHLPAEHPKTPRFWPFPDEATIEDLYRVGVQAGNSRAKNLPEARA